VALANTLVERADETSQTWWADTEEHAKKLLAEAIAGGDATEANQAWFLCAVARARSGYLAAYREILSEEYYKAWCSLEQVEIILASLRRNPILPLEHFRIERLEASVRNWQATYPYKVFFSPSFTIRRQECTICGLDIHPWSNCQHQIGKVYLGRECYAIVQDAELNEISIVTDPVQKYSVPLHIEDSEGNKVDIHNYSIVRFVAERLQSPLDRWSVEWTKAYHPHSMFPDRKPDDNCPCDSGKAYRDCCFSKPGIVRPHVQIGFENPPPKGISNAEFAGYGDRSGPARFRIPERKSEE
jgi:hypothetical protein